MTASAFMAWRGCRTRGRTGSVLLETVLVLPLLLLLFGGLFIVGDILHGRLHQLTLDRVAAWSPESRFEVGRKDLFRQWFRHLRPHTALRLEQAFTDLYNGEGTGGADDGGQFDDWFACPMPGGKSLRGTEWLDVAGGRSYARVDVPMWAAMANTHAVVNGRDRGEWLSSEWRLQVDESPNAHPGTYRSFNRAYIVRRVPDSRLSDDYVRSRPVTDLEWFAIPLDAWPGDENRSNIGEKVSLVRPRHAFSRHPTAVVYGEF